MLEVCNTSVSPIYSYGLKVTGPRIAVGIEKNTISVKPV